jgi:hypothetical protein
MRFVIQDVPDARKFAVERAGLELILAASSDVEKPASSGGKNCVVRRQEQRRPTVSNYASIGG